MPSTVPSASGTLHTSTISSKPCFCVTPESRHTECSGMWEIMLHSILTCGWTMFSLLPRNQALTATRLLAHAGGGGVLLAELRPAAAALAGLLGVLGGHHVVGRAHGAGFAVAGRVDANLLQLDVVRGEHLGVLD